MSRLSPVSLAAALALLGGCAGTEVTYGQYAQSPYSPSHYALAATDGPVPVTIIGNPMPVAPERFTAAVVEAMQEKNFPPKLRFATTPRPDRRYDYRVVMAFGRLGAGYNDLCSTPAVPLTAAPAGRVDAQAYFCYGDLLLSRVSGAVGGVERPEDPGFQRLIAQMVIELFPIVDPNRDEDGLRISG